MSNGYTNLNPGINVEGTEYFSASFSAAKIAPVSAVMVSGLPEGRFVFSLNISCAYRDEVVFSCKKLFSDMDCRLFDSEGGRLLVHFDFSDFDINNSFLDSLTAALNTEYVCEVSVNGAAYAVSVPVTLTAADEFAGIEAHPETLAAFLTPESDSVSYIVEHCKTAGEWTTFEEAAEITGKLINKIRSMNIICVKKDSYSPEKRQHIRSVDMLCGKSSVVATSLELAVLFCSAAEKCGLDSIITFVKNTLGIVSIYCGVSVRKESSFIISESITALRKSLDDGEMLLFDPAVLSSAQVLDVSHASFLASEIMHKAGTDMILSVGMGKSFRTLVLQKKRSSTISDARTVLGEIYSGISDRTVFKMLSGNYSAYDVVPLMGYDGGLDEEISVRPMEISERIADFRDISDDFASFAFKDLKKKEYNQSELLLIRQKFDEFKNRIKSKNFITAGVYEKFFHDRMSRICYGSAPGYKSYLIAGFMRLTDAKKAETLYFPLSFCETEIGCDYDYFFKAKESGLIVNPVLASYLSAEDTAVLAVDSIDKVYDFFEKLAAKSAKSGDFSEISVIREYALIKADLCDAVLWSNLNKNGKVMLANTNFTDVLTGKHKEHDNNAENEFTFPRFVPYETKKVIASSGNTVVVGKCIKEKSDVIVNKAVYAVAQGKKSIVTSCSSDFNDEVFNELNKEGLGELMLRLDGGMTSAQLVELINKRISEISETSINPSSGILTDYDKIYERLKAYHKAMSVHDPVLGITVPDGIVSFFRACEAEDGSEVKILKVKNSAFANMSQHKFNVLFERAENLVETAAKTLAAAGVSRVSPLKEHPLYPVKRKCLVNEADMSEMFETVSKITSVISDYRETFYDISPIMGFDISDIKTLDSLYALNELYRLVISARELEIPDGISGSDITSFADNANRLKTELGRAENIEYRLKFFGKEIFEDVDALLSGYSPSDSGNGNFIKKFLVKKNNKDVLLQYVPDESKNEFNQHSVDEIYSLLEEYRQIKARTSITDSYLGKENSVKLAELIKAAEACLSVIYPGIENDETKLAQKIGGFCNFIKCVTSDAALSKKLTYARAKLALVYSENECLLSALSDKLNADFALLSFDSGILDYDGICAYLKELEKNLPVLEYWNNYLDAKIAADEYMPEFSEYIENYGIKANTDRVFAASLILPAVGYLIDKYDIIKHKKNYESIKDKYSEMYEKARKLSSVNAVISYRQRIKHFAETENLSVLDKDSELSLSLFVNKHKKIILSVFPIVFADALSVGNMFGCGAVADLLIAGSFENTENILLACASAAKNIFMIKYSDKDGILTNKLAASGAAKADISYAIYSGNRAMGALAGVNKFWGFEKKSTSVGLLTVNGTMRRVSDGVNTTEAETCVSKAAELYSKSGKTVAVFTLTHGQATFIKHLFNFTAENDKNVAEALKNGSIAVFEPSAVCFKKFDVVLVSIGASSDKNGSIGWSYGCDDRLGSVPAFTGAFNCANEATIIVSSLTVKELTKLRKCSSEADKLFLTIIAASRGITVLNNFDESFAKDGLSPVINSHCGNIVPASGFMSTVAEGVDIENGVIYMYDCDIDGNVFDRLYQTELLGKAGADFVSLSLLDNIIEKLKVIQ